MLLPGHPDKVRVLDNGLGLEGIFLPEIELPSDSQVVFTAVGVTLPAVSDTDAAERFGLSGRDQTPVRLPSRHRLHARPEQPSPPLESSCRQVPSSFAVLAGRGPPPLVLILPHPPHDRNQVAPPFFSSRDARAHFALGIASDDRKTSK
eukprot:486974-Rhodomonas_salina.2